MKYTAFIPEQTFSLFPAEIKKADQARYEAVNRRFQGIPSIAVTQKGTLYAVWYTGGGGEGPGNFCVLARSADQGKTWIDPCLVVAHALENVRCFDPNIWVSPEGELILFWAQSYTDRSEKYRKAFINDGCCGVWMARSRCPDEAETPCFDPPRRITDGIMMNKPCILSDSSWALPVAIWDNDVDPFVRNALPFLQERIGSYLLVSKDQGETFQIRTSVQIPERCFDECMAVELSNGILRMFVRTTYGIGYSDSSDKGISWGEAQRFFLKSPNSRFHVSKLRSGRILFIYNEDDSNLDPGSRPWRPRHRMTAALFSGDLETLEGTLLIDPDESSYPDACEDSQGTIHVIYDSQRYGGGFIKHVILNEEMILAGNDEIPEIPVQIISSYPHSTAN